MNHSERERMFEELFQRHKAPIQRLCFAWLNSPGEVEDLFQEIMSNVWNALPKFRGDAQAGTWLYRVAVNTALLYRRKWRRAEPLPERLRRSFARFPAARRRSRNWPGGARLGSCRRPVSMAGCRRGIPAMCKPTSARSASARWRCSHFTYG